MYGSGIIISLKPPVTAILLRQGMLVALSSLGVKTQVEITLLIVYSKVGEVDTQGVVYVDNPIAAIQN